jgi:serine/threonine-protein kinase
MRVIGRYALFDEIAAGGMATVHIGRLLGESGFARTVAIKRLHKHLAVDPDFIDMFLDEARVAARLQHPNVVHTLDVMAAGDEILLVMEYVGGESLARLARSGRARGQRVPPDIVASVIANVMHGLHAAHEAKSERGEPLEIVHRDVSPQNVLVGLDGVARVLDFGVAKALGRAQSTRDGQLKGKLSYMSPEQVATGLVDRRCDIYAAGVVAWEALTGERMRSGESEVQVYRRVLDGTVDPPSKHAPDLDPALEAAVMKALAANPAERYQTAREMAVAFEQLPHASASRVGEWVADLAGEAIQRRASRVQEIETSSVSALETAARETLTAPPPPAPGDGSLATASASMQPQRAPRARVVSLAVIGLITAVGLVALGAFLVGTRSKGSALASETPHPPLATAIPSVPSAPAQVPPPVSAASSASAMPDAIASAPPTIPPARPRPSPAAAPAPVTNDCQTPYYFDAQGVKHYKTKCWQK